jgi:hypothetical protein
MCRDKLREGFCNYTIDNILINMIEKSFNEVFEEIEIEEETMIEFEIAKAHKIVIAEFVESYYLKI